MIRKIYHCVFVSRSRIGHRQFVLIVERIDNFSTQFSREALFAICTYVGQFQSLSLGSRNILRGPQTLVEPLKTTVQSVVTIILRQVVCGSIESEFPMRDPVTVPPDQGAEESLVRQISLDAVIAKHDVFELAFAIRSLERDDNATEVGDGDFHALLVGQGVKIHRTPVAGLAE